MTSAEIPRSQKNGTILKGRLARMVFQQFAADFKKGDGPIKLQKKDYSQLYEVLTSNLSGCRVRKIRCLVELIQGKSLEAVAAEFKVPELFLVSLVGRLKRDGLKGAILMKACPFGIAQQRKVYEEAIRVVSVQPLPSGFKSWTREALAYAVKVHLQLELRPDVRDIAKLLKDMDFVKWNRRYIARDAIR
jgi:transposase